MRYASMHCTFTAAGDCLLISGPCIVTKKTITVKVPKEALKEYGRGKLIHEAMPMLTAEEREFLISGFSAEGWEAKFGKEE